MPGSRPVMDFVFFGSGVEVLSLGLEFWVWGLVFGVWCWSFGSGVGVLGLVLEFWVWGWSFGSGVGVVGLGWSLADVIKSDL